MPAISVLMPVFNAQRYLRESIESVLSQTFTDFEFLIFNDGSTDGSADIIRSYSDPRIIFVDFNYNQGYVALLNMGLQKSRGKYIARMDADDISHPERFQMQLNFLEQNPSHIICGSHASILGKKDVILLPTEDEDIRLKMLYITPFCHPSVMMRTKSLQDHSIFYEPDHMPAEDHELWVKLSAYGMLSNLPKALLQYRIHDSNVSMKTRTKKQIDNLRKAQLNYIVIFFGTVLNGLPDAEILHDLFFKETAFTFNELSLCGTLVERIVSQNHSYPVEASKVHQLLAEKFFYKCNISTGLGLKSFTIASKFDFVNVRVSVKLKLLIKALLRYQG